MKLKKVNIFFSYLKQLLLVLGLLYAFSNCQVKKSILHFTAIDFVEFSQKSQSQLPLQNSCSTSLIQKKHIVKKIFSAPEIPSILRIQSFYFHAKENTVLNKLQIHPSFEFNKKSITYPPMFILFENLKIAPAVV